MTTTTVPDSMLYSEALVAGDMLTSAGWITPTSERVTDIVLNYEEDAYKFEDDKIYFDLRTLDEIIDELDNINANVIYMPFN